MVAVAALPGTEISIKIDGSTAPEIYDSRTIPDQHNKATRYIQTVSDALFAVEFKTDVGAIPTGQSLAFALNVDGHQVRNTVISGHDRGVWTCEGQQISPTTLKLFCFQDLNIIEGKTTAAQPKQGLGCIDVTVQYCKITSRSDKPVFQSERTLDSNVSGKFAAKEAMSQYASFAGEKSVKAASTVTTVPIGSVVATYKILYRSEHDLRAVGLVS